MLEILGVIVLGGIFLILMFYFTKWYEECKQEGYIFNGKKED